MSAYAETYVAAARNAFGAMLVTGAAALDQQLPAFYQLFLTSSYAARFEQGDIAIIAGRSGAELALSVLEELGVSTATQPGFAPACTHAPEAMIAPSPVFWAGWALCYYQWACGDSFSHINNMVSIEEVEQMFQPFHEMDIRAFCEEMDQRRSQAQANAPCKNARLRAGLSQGALAILSGVPVRSIQQYEQRQKSINRASAETVFALARALCCDPGDLLEHDARSVYEYAVVEI